MIPTRKIRKPRPKPPLEHVEALAFVQVVSLHQHKHPELQWLHSVPNGGARSKAQAGKLKAEGVKAGVPDYLFPVRCGHAPGWAGELKRLRGGVASPEQLAWLEHYRQQGWSVCLAKGWVELWESLKAHLALARAM